jgi:hypothetical protein
VLIFIFLNLTRNLLLHNKSNLISNGCMHESIHLYIYTCMMYGTFSLIGTMEGVIRA